MEAYTLDKFDWERFQKTGRSAVDMLATVNTVHETMQIGIGTTRDPDEVVTEAFNETFGTEDAGQAEFPLVHDGAAYICRVEHSEVSYAAELRITAPEVPDITVFEGEIESFDEGLARDRVDYAFDVHRRAIKQAAQTLLSEREAEVLLVEAELAHDPSDVLDVADSTIRTHRRRINEKVGDAREQLETADRTLELLNTHGIEASA